MKKRSRNSLSLRSSVGFPELGYPELKLARPFFPPCPTALDEMISFFAGVLEQWAELDLHGTMPIVRKQLLDPTAKRQCPMTSNGLTHQIRACPVQGTQLHSTVPNPDRGFSRYDTPNTQMKNKRQTNSTEPQNTETTKLNPNRG